jgi:class 3 adenylate cyclase
VLISYGPILAVLPWRLWVFRRRAAALAGAHMTPHQVFRLPRKAFAADLAAWCLAGLVMVGIYYWFFIPYVSTGIKVLVGCAAFGLFSGMLSYLATERRVVSNLKGRRNFTMPSGRHLTLSRKIFILIVSVVGMIALAILLMVLLDVYYLIGRDFSQPEIYWGIFKEIAFALVVLLGIALVVVRRFASNLKEILDTQLAAMDEISQGNLETQVPVLSGDEFARVAEKTNQMMEGLKERDLCRTSFDQYVSPEVSRKILDDRIAPSGDLIDVSVLFCDLRNYTGFAEKHNPREVVAMLNQYFTAMERVIRHNGGVVLQFIGDEIEAVFGAPEPDENHPENALAAALAMRAALADFNAERTARGENEIRHGIGIHSGHVLAGNVGSDRRKTYSMLGDTVNLASRLQTLNKKLRTDILISGETRRRVSRADIQLKSMGNHAIRGKSETVDVYAVA